MRRQAVPYLLLLPVLLLVFSVYGYPLVQGVYLAFHKLYLLRSGEMKFVGWDNFARLLDDPVFRLSMTNSVYWVGGANAGKVAVGLGLALLLNTKIKPRGFLRGLAILPWVMPIVVTGIVWRWIYHPVWGVFDDALLRSGLIREPIDWLGSEKFRWFAIILTDTWKNYGFLFVCFLSGLQSIPTEVYEAARIDGAGAWQRFVYVTLPQLKPVTLIVVLLSVGWTFKDFNMIWLLTRGGPGHASMVYGPFVYKQAFEFFRFGYASAAGVVGFVLIMILCLVYVRRIRLENL